MVRVTSVGMGDVLNSSPLTDMVLPTVSEPPEKSSSLMLESVMTLIVVIGGIAPVNNADAGVRVMLPLLWSMLLTDR